LGKLTLVVPFFPHPSPHEPYTQPPVPELTLLSLSAKVSMALGPTKTLLRFPGTPALVKAGLGPRPPSARPGLRKPFMSFIRSLCKGRPFTPYFPAPFIRLRLLGDLPHWRLPAFVEKTPEVLDFDGFTLPFSFFSLLFFPFFLARTPRPLPIRIQTYFPRTTFRQDLMGRTGFPEEIVTPSTPGPPLPPLWLDIPGSSRRQMTHSRLREVCQRRN